MKVFYGGSFSSPYQRRLEEKLHAELVDEFNSRTVHPKYSRPCRTCGKTFVGGDWALLEKPFCSMKCELAAYDKIHFAEKYKIELFWHDFGKYFYLLEYYFRGPSIAQTDKEE